MSLADLLLTRAAAAAHATAQEAYQLHGGGERYRTCEAAREARTKAQDAVDAASKVTA